ncbi:cell division protein FtsQ/DivIB [Micromonosporaceae bacterium DT55]|uniref:cell division protein FtsQ/DivIB n=1 Tax=Melissospora conviva TaxID=3388432 RepID=UPI003C14C635
MTPGRPRGRTRAGEGGAAPGGRADRTGAGRWKLVRAGNDAVPPSVRRFMQRARRRRMRAALPWAVGAGVVALAGVLAWVLLGTGVFAVTRVQVTGAELVTPARVREAAAVPAGTPLARVDLTDVAARIGTLPEVERAEVGRDWPDTLTVRVIERTPLAVVPGEDGFRVIDAAGVVFRTVAQAPEGLPVVRLAEPGPDDPETDAAVEVLTALTPELRAELVEITVTGLAGIRLRLAGERTVVWGDATSSPVKAAVATELLKREGTMIDVSVPDVVTIR